MNDRDNRDRKPIPGFLRVGLPWFYIVIVLVLFHARLLAAQTFQQITNLSGTGQSRITRAFVVAELNAPILGAVYGGSTVVTPEGTFQFVADGMWGRVALTKLNKWIRSFTNANGFGGRLEWPTDVDASVNGLVYIADYGAGRVLITSFNGEVLVPVGSIAPAVYAAPFSVAWDGGTSPLTQENFYALDKALGNVSYWQKNGSTWTRYFVFGSSGFGTGQFYLPEGICVGRANQPSGDSFQTNDFYVMDTGNNRIIWLSHTGASVTWRKTRTILSQGKPVDCTVDHFGNVYVADKQNSRLIKYTRGLQEITTYGSYGTGANNLNTFAHPSAVSVPISHKSSSSPVVGDGRIITGEDWIDDAGGVEHWLGIDIQSSVAWGGPFGASTDYSITDHGKVTIDVMSGTPGRGSFFRNLQKNFFRSPLWNSAGWDGTDQSGNFAPAGSYYFQIKVVSAYGCTSTWCQKTVNTNTIQWNGAPCPNPELCAPPELNVALALDGEIKVERLPESYRLGQVISDYAGPVFRVEGSQSVQTATAAAMTDQQAVRSVRRSGIRALSLDVPRGEGNTRVRVHIYSLNGRLVRRLVDETLDPGRFVVGWDAKDDNGREVLPGVYIAVMSSGSFRGKQRLIIK